MIRFKHEMEKAKRIVVDIEGDVQKYAMSFLHIVNTARVNRNAFYNVKNCYDNRVYVTCSLDEFEAVKEYLANFGKIVAEYDVQKVNVWPEYDNSKDYDTLFPDDYDTEFYIEVD